MRQTDLPHVKKIISPTVVEQQSPHPAVLLESAAVQSFALLHVHERFDCLFNGDRLHQWLFPEGDPFVCLLLRTGDLLRLFPRTSLC